MKYSLELIEGFGWVLNTDSDVFQCSHCKEVIKGDGFYFHEPTGRCFHTDCGKKSVLYYNQDYELHNVVRVNKV